MTKNRLAKKNNNLGFTLVELIVVLVILAILAAILTPALIGWIDKAKKKQDMLEAKNCITAAQVEFANYYATRGDGVADQVCVIPLSKAGLQVDGKYDNRDSFNYRNNDIYLFKNSKKEYPQYKEFTQKILKTAGYDNESDYPYYLIIGAGHYEKYIKDDPHKPYTIYFAMFQKTAKSKPIFFDGNKWTEEYPKNASDNTLDAKDKDYNFYMVNGEKIKIQYYLLCNNDPNKNWWQALPENAKR